MKTTKIAGGAFAVVLVLLALVAGYRALDRAMSPPVPPPSAGEERPDPGFLYGRITTVEGTTYEGRLRWGGDQEAFWGDYFNGAKKENPWAAHVPPERLPKAREPIEIFGFQITAREQPAELNRLFMARFGDIARVEARGRDVLVTLKSGTLFDLGRFEASDFDDGVRVWDGKRGVADLDSLRVRLVEMLPYPGVQTAPNRLHGTVYTRNGAFTGFIQWDRNDCVGSDELDGNTDKGELKLRFDTIRSIARRGPDSSLVKLRDGREILLAGSREVGEGNRGAYVDDPRYGRVLVPWDAFERVEFSPGGSSPAYSDFPTGNPLTGAVTTRAGRRLAGRLVFDLDESETTETLDAPSQGIDYTILFGLVASIALPRDNGRSGKVTLHSGEALQLELTGDLGSRNAGMLIFADGRPGAEYVSWPDVQQIDLNRPPAMYPPFDRR